MSSRKRHQTTNKWDLNALIRKYLPDEPLTGKGVTKKSLIKRLESVGIYVEINDTPDLINVSLDTFLSEILAEIFSHSRDVRILRSLLCSCRTFDQIARTYPVVWKTQIRRVCCLPLPEETDLRKTYWGILKIPDIFINTNHEGVETFLLAPGYPVPRFDSSDPNIVDWFNRYAPIETLEDFYKKNCGHLGEIAEINEKSDLDSSYKFRSLFERSCDDITRIFNAMLQYWNDNGEDDVIPDKLVISLLQEALGVSLDIFRFFKELIKANLSEETCRCIVFKGLYRGGFQIREFILEDCQPPYSNYEQDILVQSLINLGILGTNENFYELYRFLVEKGLNPNKVGFRARQMT